MRHKNSKNILCIIPARGGSKGLKNKNIMPIMGKPLIGYTIEAALDSKLINKIVVSTDDEKIAKVAKKYDQQVVKRPKKYATSTAPIEQALRHAVEYVKIKENYVADAVVWLQANVPIRKKGQIDKVINLLLSRKADSAVTLKVVSQYPQWMKIINKKNIISPLYPKVKEYRRQDIKSYYLLDGAIIAIKTEVLMGTKNMKGAHVYLGRKIVGVVEEEKYSIEIDNRDDYELVKYHLNKNICKG